MTSPLPPIVCTLIALGASLTLWALILGAVWLSLR